MTDENYVTWLSSPSAMKCILVEVGANVLGSETTFYLSNRGYTTSPTDTNPNISYLPVVRGGLDISNSIGVSDFSPSISWGDIEISNINGEFDEWLGYIWKNKNINVFLGDMTWPQSDFRLIFTGQVDDIDSRNRNTINIKIRDKLQKLNTSISESLLGGSTSNKDRLKPLCFGECHNIEPLLIDPVLLKYQVHNGVIEDIIEVRDNGVPVSITKDNLTGTFTLVNSPLGTITASVQGAKFSGFYLNTVSNLIKSIVKTYGNSVLSDSDIDLDSFNTFESLHTQPVGIYITDKSNIISVISDLAASVGAQVVMSSQGKLQLVKVDLSVTTEDTVIDETVTKEKTLELSEKLEVIAAVALNYCKNYTVQNGLQTGLPPEHISLYAREWLEAVASDAGVASDYGVSVEVSKVNTLLLTTTDAQTEANRRLDIFKVQRFKFKLVTDLSPILNNLGDYVKIYNSRFGFSAGKIGQIVSMDVNWFNNNVTMEVLV